VVIALLAAVPLMFGAVALRRRATATSSGVTSRLSSPETLPAVAGSQSRSRAS
jgi:hypothetical protein